MFLLLNQKNKESEKKGQLYYKFFTDLFGNLFHVNKFNLFSRNTFKRIGCQENYIFRVYIYTGFIIFITFLAS